LLRVAAVPIIASISAFFLWQSNQVRVATAAFDRANKIAAQLSGAGWQGNPGDFIDMNRAGAEAARTRPDDIRFRYWWAMNQWYTISDVHDPVTGDVLLDQAKTKTLRASADDLQAARWICPTFGPLYAQLGQWEQDFFGQSVDGARHIRMAFQLAPGDATVCFILATLEAEEGNWAESVTHFRRAADLDRSMFGDAADLYVSYFNRPTVAVDLAGDSVERLRLVAQKLRDRGKDQSVGPTTGPATRPADERAALDADARAERLIRALAAKPDASAEILGEMGLICARDRDYKAACSYLERALWSDYGRQDWRLVYAKCLIKIGDKEKAAEQARAILRAQPQMIEAQDILDDLFEPTTQAIHDVMP
jgi:tetratricopeptide (TPR) repeat protein